MTSYLCDVVACLVKAEKRQSESSKSVIKSTPSRINSDSLPKEFSFSAPSISTRVDVKVEKSFVLPLNGLVVFPFSFHFCYFYLFINL
jgi:hypothetical protein